MMIWKYLGCQFLSTLGFIASPRVWKNQQIAPALLHSLENLTMIKLNFFEATIFGHNIYLKS